MFRRGVLVIVLSLATALALPLGAHADEAVDDVETELEVEVVVDPTIDLEVNWITYRGAVEWFYTGGASGTRLLGLTITIECTPSGRCSATEWPGRFGSAPPPWNRALPSFTISTPATGALCAGTFSPAKTGSLDVTGDRITGSAETFARSEYCGGPEEISRRTAGERAPNIELIRLDGNPCIVDPNHPACLTDEPEVADTAEPEAPGASGDEEIDGTAAGSPGAASGGDEEEGGIPPWLLPVGAVGAAAAAAAAAAAISAAAGSAGAAGAGAEVSGGGPEAPGSASSSLSDYAKTLIELLDSQPDVQLSELDQLGPLAESLGGQASGAEGGGAEGSGSSSLKDFAKSLVELLDGHPDVQLSELDQLGSLSDSLSGQGSGAEGGGAEGSGSSSLKDFAKSLVELLDGHPDVQLPELDQLGSLGESLGGEASGAEGVGSGAEASGSGSSSFADFASGIREALGGSLDSSLAEINPGGQLAEALGLEQSGEIPQALNDAIRSYMENAISTTDPAAEVARMIGELPAGAGTQVNVPAEAVNALNDAIRGSVENALSSSDPSDIVRMIGDLISSSGGSGPIDPAGSADLSAEVAGKLTEAMDGLVDRMLNSADPGADLARMIENFRP